MATNKNRTGMISEAVQTLLDERTQFQQWLAKLDDVLSDFRPAVTGRVRSDYEERLGAVESKLGTHTAELETSLADRLSGLKELASQHDAKSADLEEARLRHEVGEYARSEWEKMRTEYGSVLEDLNKQLKGNREAVEELEGVLSELTGRPGSVMAMQTLPDLDEVEAEDDEPAAPVETVAVVTGSVARRNQGDDVFLGELEFLESLSMDDSPSFDKDG